MYSDRLEIYKKLEKEFKSKVITYVTGDRPNMATQIAQDVIDPFVNQLDSIGTCNKISLVLYTRGGNTSAARNIVNLIRMYCDELQVIIPHKAHSAGTIISLGANEIVMTKQATLGPIDPSLNSEFNPIVNNRLTSVSVEAVKGYLEFAKQELKIESPELLTELYKKLTDNIHPLVLGEVYRSKAQIPMMAEKLLENQKLNKEKVKKIIDFLCSESGSHDYTINRREAKNDLGLKIRKPNDKQYKLIKKLYDDINDELQLNNPFFIKNINGTYIVRRSILESVDGGADYFSTEGIVTRGNLPDGQIRIQNNINFEGWKHDYIAI